MIKKQVLMVGLMILATLLGVNGQSIAYYLAGNMAVLSAVHYLTILTVLSILLFLATPVMVYRYNQNNEKKRFAITVSINFFISIPVSIWSLFVLVMWWG